MAFQKPKAPPEFADLLGILAQSRGIDTALYQVVQEIINRLDQFVGSTVESTQGPAGPPGSSGSLDETFITAETEPTLVNHRRLDAGTNITLDSTTPGQLVINSSAVGGGAHAPTHSFTAADPVSVLNLAGFPSENLSFLRGDRVFAVPPGITPPNVAYTNVANIFTLQQTINATSPTLVLLDASGTVDARRYNISVTASGSLSFHPLSDVGGGQAGFPVLIDRAGAIFAQSGLGSTPLNATQLTSGTVNDLRLSSNVALENVANTFTQDQTISKTNPRFGLNATDGAPDARLWRAYVNVLGTYNVSALNDAATVIQATGLSLTRDGSVAIGNRIFERGRTLGLGEAQETPFAAGDYTAVGGGIWTVTAAGAFKNRYALVGKYIIWHLYISWFSGAGTSTIAGPVSQVHIKVPAGLSTVVNQFFRMPTASEATGSIEVNAEAVGTTVKFTKVNGTNWAVGNIGFIGTLIFEIN